MQTYGENGADFTSPKYRDITLWNNPSKRDFVGCGYRGEIRGASPKEAGLGQRGWEKSRKSY